MTRDHDSVEESIDRAAETVGSVWPLHSFVTANPLAGFEDRPFHRAVAEAADVFGGRGYPRTSVFRQAWEDGRIDRDVLTAKLDAHDIDRSPESLLDEMAAAESAGERKPDPGGDAEIGALDRIVSKWLAAFLDQGTASWPMPNRAEGFYAAWRRLAPHDEEIPDCQRSADLPETTMDALTEALSDYPQRTWEAIFEQQLTALPGWTGFIKQRAETDADPWQSTYPISLADYLAVRLTLADLLGVSLDPAATFTDDVDAGTEGGDAVPLAELWLAAWEDSYRRRLLDQIGTSGTGDEAMPAGNETTPAGDDEAMPAGGDETTPAGDDEATPAAGNEPSPNGRSASEGSRPAAQLVFCIDTRSEVIRRHIEQAGPYETHGYAGFFGIPMRYQEYGADAAYDACPPIVDPQHHITDRLDSRQQADAATHDQVTKLLTAGRKHLKTLKQNVAAAFTFVEGAGSAYGAAMTARTLFPSRVYDAIDAVDSVVPDPGEFCTPALDHRDDDHRETSLPRGMTLGEKVAYAETAFELMGWEEFARLVVFTGHASQTTNNPFGSSLDCGACAGNRGGPSARVLAAICNDEDVRSALCDRGFDVPEDTVFLAAEHNTTTDEITLFDSAVPAGHEADLARLRDDLAEARAGAAAERTGSTTDAGEAAEAGDTADAVREVERRAADWAETRPEWGLAGNASFVVGPRELTADENLEGRAFLHSYDWSTDPEGEALEAIMTGPLVVTQWINNQYYFATVDNAVYGSGSKVTQNPVGNVGVYQGNGGDLLTGLPLQSLYADHEQPAHQPLRLTTVIQAPVDRVTEILSRHGDVAQLFDNGWMRLTVLDPTRDDEVVHYQGDLEWTTSRSTQASGTAPLVERQ